ncbi:hypothetical protein BT96DRAFT_1005501 [Gymnopus androsaceus JB14]|uniref:Uncharacterized protein n=1 Tax=Gymnopus androsaceus JB14 TaxID=1447944 RepID=A0A6A4GP90_9AGAR|nr:hypothetical protein BT96DRAFT_1005501 [Gymnopus androsaceus JB14]
MALQSFLDSSPIRAPPHTPTLLRIPGEDPIHLNTHGTPHMVLDLRSFPQITPETVFPDHGEVSPSHTNSTCAATKTVSTPTPAARKHAAGEDFTQRAATESRKLKLNVEHDQELQEIAKTGGLRSFDIWMAGQMLAIRERMDVIQPADTKFEVPAALTSVIEDVSVKVFLDPTLSAYLNRPNERLLTYLKARLSILSKAVKGHKPAMKIITTKISSRFTHHRNDTKDMIASSLGKYDKDAEAFTEPFVAVIELTRKIIVAVGGKSCDLVASVPLVARIAFLQQVYVHESAKNGGKAGTDFWKCVDESLKTIREAKKDDTAKISAVFAKILNNDQEVYDDQLSPEDIDSLVTIAHTVNVD